MENTSKQTFHEWEAEPTDLVSINFLHSGTEWKLNDFDWDGSLLAAEPSQEDGRDFSAAVNETADVPDGRDASFSVSSGSFGQLSSSTTYSGASLLSNAISPRPGLLSNVFPESDCPNLTSGRIPCECTDTDQSLLIRLQEKRPDILKGLLANVCQVADCSVNLKLLKGYHKKYRICTDHAKASSVLHCGLSQRFCQQCGRFHPLEDFDDDKRSCRRKLEKHNNRRRKNANNSLSSSQLSVKNPDVKGFDVKHGSRPSSTSQLDFIDLKVPKRSKLASPTVAQSATLPPPASAVQNSSISHSPTTNAYNSPNFHENDQKGDPYDTQGSLTALLQTEKECVDEWCHYQAETELFPDRQLAIEQQSSDSIPFQSPLWGGGTDNYGQIEEQEPTQDHCKHSACGLVDSEAMLAPPPLNTEPMAFESSSPFVGHPSAPSATNLDSSNGAYSSPLPTHKLSFKFYDWNPADFPRDLRDQILAWLAQMPSELEGYIRPGCTLLSLYFTLPSCHLPLHNAPCHVKGLIHGDIVPALEVLLSRDMCQKHSAHRQRASERVTAVEWVCRCPCTCSAVTGTVTNISAERDDRVFRQGRMLVQTNSQLVYVVDGTIEGVQSLGKPETECAPLSIRSVTPVAVSAASGKATDITISLSLVSVDGVERPLQADFRVFCSVGGQLVIEEEVTFVLCDTVHRLVDSSAVFEPPLYTGTLTLRHDLLGTKLGTLWLEVESASQGCSNSLPILLAPLSLTEQLSRLAASRNLPYSSLQPLLEDLGWVLSWQQQGNRHSSNRQPGFGNGRELRLKLLQTFADENGLSSVSHLLQRSAMGSSRTEPWKMKEAVLDVSPGTSWVRAEEVGMSHMLFDSQKWVSWSRALSVVVVGSAMCATLCAYGWHPMGMEGMGVSFRRCLSALSVLISG